MNCVECPLSQPGALFECLPSPDITAGLSPDALRTILDCVVERQIRGRMAFDTAVDEVHGRVMDNLNVDMLPEAIAQNEAEERVRSFRLGVANEALVNGFARLMRSQMNKVELAEPGSNLDSMSTMKQPNFAARQLEFEPDDPHELAMKQAYLRHLQFVTPAQEDAVGVYTTLKNPRLGKSQWVRQIRPIPIITIGEKWSEQGKRYERLAITPSESVKALWATSEDALDEGEETGANFAVVRIAHDQSALSQRPYALPDTFGQQKISAAYDARKRKDIIKQSLWAASASDFPQAAKVAVVESISDKDMVDFCVENGMRELAAAFGVPLEQLAEEYGQVRQKFETSPDGSQESVKDLQQTMRQMNLRYF